MLITKELLIKWLGNNKAYYTSKGYIFTNYGDEFLCDFDDIPQSSDRLIELKCDYCGKEIEKPIKKYYNGLKIVNKDCCFDCRDIKKFEAKKIKYGTISPYVNGHTIDKHKAKYAKVYEEIWKQIQDICKDRNYLLITNEYTNNHTKIDYICLNHVKEGVQSIDWIHLKSDRGCKFCAIESRANSQRFTLDHVKNIIEKEFEDDNCKLISDTYTAYSDYNLNIQCNCGDTFETSLAWFILGKRKCNNCTCSIGEKMVNDHLITNQISFIREYEIFPINWDFGLYIDFYIPDLKIAIEYDGEQHYKPVDFKGEGILLATEKFQKGLVRDTIKNQYCIDNGIKLIRIPYWNRNHIAKLLQEEIGA